MMTGKNKKQMTNALNRAKVDIRDLTGRLEAELEKYTADKSDWATVGSLGYVRERLLDAVAFLNNVEPREIQALLDKQNS